MNVHCLIIRSSIFFLKKIQKHFFNRKNIQVKVLDIFVFINIICREIASSHDYITMKWNIITKFLKAVLEKMTSLNIYKKFTNQRKQ